MRDDDNDLIDLPAPILDDANRHGQVRAAW